MRTVPRLASFSASIPTSANWRRPSRDSTPRSTTSRRIAAAGSLADATAVLEEDAVDCVVATYDRPDGTALEPFECVRDSQPDAGYILYTTRGHADLETAACGETITE